MLTRIHGKIQVECDDCSDVLDTETSDFGEARFRMKSENWFSERTERGWSHYCERCFKKKV